MATVTTEAELRSAIQTGTDPEVYVANDITVTSVIAVNRSVTIRTVSGNPTATLFANMSIGVANRYIFQINASGSLTADTLIMDSAGRDCGLVKLLGGTYIMNDGVTLTGIKSTTAKSAVYIGEMGSSVGGTFIMNGGLITGADVGPHAVVFCVSGAVTMSGNAAIENNPSEGLTTTGRSQDGSRSTVKITENVRISNNSAGQSGGGVVLIMTDAVIGENDDDAPVISENYSPYNAGGVLALEGSTVSIGGKTQISGNSAVLTTGGILVLSESVLYIGADVKVNGNKAGANCGGIGVGTNSRIFVLGNAEISGNSAGDKSIAGGLGVGSGGGIMLQTGAELEISGTVSIHDNTAENGGGIYLMTPPEGRGFEAPYAVVGAWDTSPSIYENTAANLGGGIFISNSCEVNLTGQATIHDNIAVRGKGVYQNGIFKVSGSPDILDGLFFDCIPVDGFSDTLSVQTLPTDKFRIESDDPGVRAIEYDVMFYGIESPPLPNAGNDFSGTLADTQQPLQCDKAPIIDGALTAQAQMQIESSGHVATSNVPLVIAVGADGAIPLTEFDRAAWQIPLQFIPGYAVMLTPDLEQVIIDAVNYTIAYDGLYGATNTNPVSYKINGLPIEFAPPGRRKEYTFVGWRDAAGNPVTEISAGSTGDLTFTAVWQADAYNIVYNNLFGGTHTNPASYTVESLPISLSAPSKRAGYAFVGWRDAAGSPVTVIPEDSSGDLAFTAVWQVDVYNIVYNNLFGGTHTNPASYTTENLPILLSAPSKRAGYAFVGWRDAARNPVTEISIGSTGNLAFTAVWQAEAYNIVYYNLFGATHSNPASYTAGNLPISLTAPSERPGYVFVGWRDAAGNPVTEIPAGSSGDLAFTAVWQAEAYNIAYYNLLGATHSNPASYTTENLPIPLAVPSERPGYVFVGWRDAAGNPITEIPAGSIGDLAFTAVWAELSLSFVANAPCVCNMPKPILAINGVAKIPNTRPCRPGHVFVCWNQLQTGKGKAYCPGGLVHVSGQNVTLYAQWLFVGCCCR